MANQPKRKAPPPSSSSSSSLRPLIVLALLVALGAAGYEGWRRWNANETAATTTATTPTTATPVKEKMAIRVIDWTGRNDDEMAAELAASRLPALVKNSVAARWKALETWTPERLSETAVRLASVYSQESPYFQHFTKNKRLQSLLGLEPTFEIRNMTGSRFLSYLLNDKTNHYYWSGRVYNLGEAAKDVEPNKPLILTEDKHYFNAWISSKGVIASCHYDMYHNFFVQIRGTKRFTIFPPADFRALHLHPNSHPAHRQCQTDFRQLEKFPDYADAHPIQFDVGPGDLLYLPPFWFHHVEALNTSMSVNMWSYTDEYFGAHDAFTIPVPIEDQWKPRSQVAAAFWFILELLDRCDIQPLRSTIESGVKPGRLPSTFIRRLREGRYLSLPAEHQAKFVTMDRQAARDEFVCSTPWQDSQALAQLPHGLLSITACRDRFDGTTAEVCRRMSPIDADAKAILIEDYIDSLVSVVFGPEKALAFYNECFA